MKWACILTLVLQGCAYTAVSTATYVVTDRTLTDHALTQLVPNGDCRIDHVIKGKYYCEISNPSETYNRSSF